MASKADLTDIEMCQEIVHAEIYRLHDVATNGNPCLQGQKGLTLIEIRGLEILSKIAEANDKRAEEERSRGYDLKLTPEEALAELQAIVAKRKPKT
jgi:hypothetical protein